MNHLQCKYILKTQNHQDVPLFIQVLHKLIASVYQSHPGFLSVTILQTLIPKPPCSGPSLQSPVLFEEGALPALQGVYVVDVQVPILGGHQQSRHLLDPTRHTHIHVTCIAHRPHCFMVKANDA